MNESSFTGLLNAQNPRQLRKYLDYGKRIKRGEIDEDFYQWLMRIIADDEIYEDKERALAFELAAAEYIVDLLETLEESGGVHLFISGTIDRLTLYLGLLNESHSWEERAAYWDLLKEKYPKHGSWIQRAREEGIPRPVGLSQIAAGQFFLNYCQQLADTADVGTGKSGSVNREIERLEDEVHKRGEALAAMEGDLEFAEDRAERAHARIKKLDEEMTQVRRQLNEARENGEKLRSERKVRISSQRESSQAQKELEILQREYIKMQHRLRDMAKRLAFADQVRSQGATTWSLDHLRSMDSRELLGVREGMSESEDLGKVRRRFASALHPDRVRGLPAWTEALFSEIMRIVNEACDRKK